MSGSAHSPISDAYEEEFFRIGDRVVLTDTSGSCFDFAGAGLVSGVSKGTVVQLPDHVGVAASVLVQFDRLGDVALAIEKRRLLLDNPLDRLEREI